jgi:hypothetical protein
MTGPAGDPPNTGFRRRWFAAIVNRNRMAVVSVSTAPDTFRAALIAQIDSDEG